MNKLLGILFFTTMIWFQALSQSSPVIYFQTSPEGATVSNKKGEIGVTPLLIDMKDLTKKITISLEGYETVEIKNINSNTIAQRLRPKNGYNLEPVRSPFYAIYNGDTIYHDPMEVQDLSRSYNCEDTDLRYRVLGNSSRVLADKFQGCGLKYIARFSISDPLLAGYFDSNDFPFPIQQVWVDISPINASDKKKRDQDFGRYKNQQHWYILAKEKDKLLLFLPSSVDPEESGRRAKADLSGEKGGQAIYGTLALKDGENLSLVTKDNFTSITDQFPSNSKLQESVAGLSNLSSFVYNLFQDPYILGDIFSETWYGQQNKVENKSSEAVQAFLDNRKQSEPISMGGQQDYWIDSSTVVSETSATPWFLKGEKSKPDSIAIADDLIYNPADTSINQESNKKGPWYLKQEDEYREVDALSPRHENVFTPKPSIKSQYPDKKAWYLKKP